MPKEQLIIVAGPTGSGKTDFAIKLAKSLKAEIINADSRQIYKGMDIGTNKEPLNSAKEVYLIDGLKVNKFYFADSKVGAWMFDIVKPDQRFTLAQYLTITNQLLTKLNEQHNNYIIVGGTGLFIDGLVNGYNIPDGSEDHKLRSELATKNVEQLQEILGNINPDRLNGMNNSDRNNPRRLIRAIEVAKQMQEYIKNSEASDYLMYYPEFTREELYTKLDQRVERIFENGFVDEVKKLLSRGYSNTEVMQGMGYYEVQKYLKGELSIDQTISIIKQQHRNYAKRQITWFEGEGRRYELTRVKF